MALTQYGVNHPSAVKLWRKQLFREALKETWISKFMGTDSNSLVQVLDDTSKSSGDKITVTLRNQLSGAGIQGDATLEGEEEALATYTDALLIDQLRHAVRNSGKMSQQRVPFSVRDEALSGLADWWADRIDQSAMNHLCGNTAQTDTRYTGNNATTAPTTTSGNTRWAFADPSGDNSAESTITAAASDQFVVSLIDKAVALAKTATPQIRPVKAGAEPYYVLFMDTWQAQDMRTGYGSGGWGDIQKAAMTGGDVAKNPIFTGALGVYSGVILHESTRMYTPNSDGGNRLARAALCGAQALGIAYGRDAAAGSDKMSWFEELFDYGNQLGVSAGMIWGMKKMVFNSNDFGVIAISSYTPAS